MSETNVTEIPVKGFELSYKAFENTPSFLSAMRKVYSCEEFPNMKSAYKVKRLCESLAKELKSYLELRKKADDEEKMTQLHDITFQVKWDKLSSEEVESVLKLSPADMQSLEYVADLSAFES